ncbi:hypothetical protein ACOME3_004581 [Neoechinorhynchus agilis]
MVHINVQRVPNSSGHIHRRHFNILCFKRECYSFGGNTFDFLLSSKATKIPQIASRSLLIEAVCVSPNRKLICVITDSLLVFVLNANASAVLKEVQITIDNRPYESIDFCWCANKGICVLLIGKQNTKLAIVSKDTASEITFEHKMSRDVILIQESDGLSIIDHHSSRRVFIEPCDPCFNKARVLVDIANLYESKDSKCSDAIMTISNHMDEAIESCIIAALKR